MSNDRVVDDFLTGMPRRTSPPVAFGGAGTSAGSMSTANMLNILNLQQRLLTVMNEAVGLVGQLQQLGAFPSDADGSNDSAVEATQLLLASMIEQQQMEATGMPMQSNNHNNNNAAVDSALGFGGLPPPPSMETAMSGGMARGVNVHNDAHNELFAAPSQAQEGAAGVGVLDKAGNGGRIADKHGENGPRMLAFVEFKRNKIRKYVCDVADVRPGTYVLVDGDRGTDCALLVQTITYDDSGRAYVVSMDECNIEDEKIKLENGRVLRAASNEDIDRLHNVIFNAEGVALKTCRQRCKELGIEIKVLDAEYQFDMKKISFYFDSDHSVDFRALVRELYRTFGARIWMENVNPRVKNAVPESHAGGGGRRRN